MQRIASVNPEQATGRARELLGVVHNAFGVTPNAARVMANSPAVLESFLSFSTAMGAAKIGEKLHNQVKLTTSEANACDYCASILAAVAPKAGLSPADVLAGRQASAVDPRTDATLKFARAVLDMHGKVSDEQLAAVRAAGLNDGEVVEVVASVVLGCLTNFINNVADTTLDVPRAEPLSCACSTNGH